MELKQKRLLFVSVLSSIIDSLQPTLHIMWQEENNTLYRSFTFADFSEAFAFMRQVALLAEEQDHHPTWTNTWNKVEIWLTTHDAGNKVTDKDWKLALSIDSLL